MSSVEPIGELNVWSIARACTPGPTALLDIDLRQCTFIRPAGLVFLGVLIEAAAARRSEIKLQFDPQSDLAKYVERMGLRRIAEEANAVCSPFPALRHHDSADRFVELTRFAATGDSIIDDVNQALQARAVSLEADTKRRLNNAVFELGVNVEQHAGSTGLVAVQNYPRRSTVEFAVGDFGVGIRRSLQDGGFVLGSDGEAIREAVETFASRLQPTETGRGKGLPALREHLCGDRLRGYLIVQSGRERVIWQHRRPTEVAELNYNVPGTLAFGMLRTR